jgi:hypothetical protein
MSNVLVFTFLSHPTNFFSQNREKNLKFSITQLYVSNVKRITQYVSRSDTMSYTYIIFNIDLIIINHQTRNLDSLESVETERSKNSMGQSDSRAHRCF